MNHLIHAHISMLNIQSIGIKSCRFYNVPSMMLAITRLAVAGKCIISS